MTAGRQSKMLRKGAYLPELDGLRAISIMMVMLGHAGYLFVPAALGVTIFFVISGYLICGLLLREIQSHGALNIKKFYIRRVLRLYPELFAYIVLILSSCAIFAWGFKWIEIIGCILYFTNYQQIYGSAHSFISPIIRPLWSLAVEEHFYLIFPFVVLACRGRAKTIFFVLLAAIVMVGVGRLLLVDLWLPPHFYFDYATESRIDAICGGCLLACIAQGADFHRILRLFNERSWPMLAIAALLLIVAVVIRNAQFRNTGRFSLEAVGSTLLLGAIVWGNHLAIVRRLLRLPPLVWIGRLSYAAYLYHLLVYALVAKLFPTDSTAYRMTAIALSFAAATVSFVLIERPILPLRRRFGANPAPAPAHRSNVSFSPREHSA